MGVSRHPVSDQKKLDRLDEVIKSKVPFMEKGVTYPKGCDEMPETIKHVLKEAVTRDLSHLSSSPDDPPNDTTSSANTSRTRQRRPKSQIAALPPDYSDILSHVPSPWYGSSVPS
jgi:hypothetical protein